MSNKYHTLVIKADLGAHPRLIQINGVDYEVAASADGHSLAEMEPVESLVSELANGGYSGHEADENIGVQTAALNAQEKAIRQRENSYDE